MENTGKKIVFDFEYVDWTASDSNVYYSSKYPKKGVFMTKDNVLLFNDGNMVCSLINMHVPFELVDETPKQKEQEHSIREQFALELVSTIMRGGKSE